MLYALAIIGGVVVGGAAVFAVLTAGVYYAIGRGLNL